MSRAIAGVRLNLCHAYSLRLIQSFIFAQNFENFFGYFVKPEVSVSQNHVQNSGPKVRLLIPDLIREKIGFASEK
jgi:hypothetical protein